mgnify:CR=1 FL=1
MDKNIVEYTHLCRAWAQSKLRSLKGRKKASDFFRLPSSPKREGQRDGLAIVAIVKDEASYLEEWIEFHSMLGARSFFIYDNGSSDETAELLDRNTWQADVKRIDWVSFDGINGTQSFAYSHALANYGVDYRWMAFIDVDEFLFPLKDANLENTLSRFHHLPGLSVPWFNFGFNGHISRPDGLVIENYTERATFPPAENQKSLLRYKSIVDPNEVTAGGSHFFAFKEHGTRLFNELGESVPAWQSRKRGFPVSEHIRLNHYFTRSEEELTSKLMKGRVSQNGGVIPSSYDARLKQYALSTTEDKSILKFVPPLKERLAKRDHGLEK